MAWAVACGTVRGAPAAIGRTAVNEMLMLIAMLGAALPADLPQNDAAVEFSLRDTHGQFVSLKGYRGSAVWLTFGATW